MNYKQDEIKHGGSYMLNINAKAMKVVREIIEDAEALGCKVIKMDCGATLIDM